jgi:hypothetical protein
LVAVADYRPQVNLQDIWEHKFEIKERREAVFLCVRLIRASKSRPSGTWSDDDYDVFDGCTSLCA